MSATTGLLKVARLLLFCFWWSFLVSSCFLFQNCLAGAIRREFATRAFSENYWRSIGLEPLARRALRDALDYQEGALTKSNPLFGEVFTLPLDNDAIATGCI